MRKLWLPLLLFVLLPVTITAYAQTTPTFGEKQIGNTDCTYGAASADFDTIAQCTSTTSSTGTMQKAPIFAGKVTSPPYAATTCDSNKAGMIQWTGTSFQGCDGSAWQSLVSSGPPPWPMAGVDNGGQVIYVAACDGGQTYSAASGCTGTRGTYAWGIYGVTTGYTSATTGKTNSAGLAALGSSYEAATYCENLTAHGYSDWYLPAENELIILSNMRYLVGNYQSAQEYWSSKEHSDIAGRYVIFSTGVAGYRNKESFKYPVRCIRRD